jgi:hypothetical protein
MGSPNSSLLLRDSVIYYISGNRVFLLVSRGGLAKKNYKPNY